MVPKLLSPVGSRWVRRLPSTLPTMSDPIALPRPTVSQLSIPPGLLGGFPAVVRRQPLRLLHARVTCGFPSPAEDYLGNGDELDLNERCIAHPAATFFVEADTGTSMVDFGIFPGDTLVVDRSLTAKHGDIVMVLWDGGYMVKQWWLLRGRLQLRSGNSEHSPIEVGPEDDLEVWGVITWSFRRQFRR